MSGEGKNRLNQRQVQELLAWKFPFAGLDIHATIEHELAVCMKGIESGVLIGPRGVGKTEAVKQIVERLVGEECERCNTDPSYMPRHIKSYTASKAVGTKTALINLFEEVCGHASPASRRFLTPKAMVNLIADEILLQRISLICVDEAQLINASNLDLLRQVPDRVAECGGTCSLFLIGSEELHAALAEIRQLGQRFATEIVMRPLTLAEIMEHMADFHPHLSAMRSTLGKAEWKRTVSAFHRKTGGKFRRMKNVVENANEMALALCRPIDMEVLGWAMEKLAEEN